jgi:Zn-dependent protease with chaperone function
MNPLVVALLVFSLFYGAVMGLMCLLAWRLAPRVQAAIREAFLTSPCGASRSQSESRLGRYYLLALLAGLVLFYAALPFVFVGMLAAFVPLLGLAVLASGKGGDGGDVSFHLLRASGGGLTAVLKAMFARPAGGVFGVRVRKGDCPRLFAEIEEVAQRVGTGPPDEVWLAPGADFWVRQEGRGPFGLFGARKRVLTLGLCVFHFLRVSELRAILAHEFAHFRHDDTFWHRFLFQVTLSLRTAQREMARTGGWVTWGNPFYWFFWCYSRSYNLLAAGFSRQQEYLADRLACALVGSDVFAEALRKVCTEGGHFERVIEENVARLLRTDQAFINMYLAFRKHREAGPSPEGERLRRQLEGQAPSPFASHPTFRERVEAAGQLPIASEQDERSALALFERPEEVERGLTDYLTEAVAARCPLPRLQ